MNLHQTFWILNETNFWNMFLDLFKNYVSIQNLTYRTDLMKPRNTSKCAQAWHLNVEASACIIVETL